MLNPQTAGFKQDVLPSPEHAVRTFIIALVLMVVGAFSFVPVLARASYGTSVILNELAFMLAIASCIFLMQQAVSKYKVLAIIFLFVSAFAFTFSATYFGLHASSMRAPNIFSLFGYIGFVRNLQSSIIIAVVVLVIALVFAMVSKKEMKQKLTTSVCICAIAVFVCRILSSGVLIAKIPISPFYIRNLISSGIVLAIGMILFALIIYTIYTIPSRPLITGSGAKIWFSFCIAVNIVMIVVGLVFASTGILSILVVVIFISGYILLLNSKRIGFPIVLLAVVFSILSGIGVAFVSGGVEAVNFITPLFGVINPLITWLVIKNSWRNL